MQKRAKKKEPVKTYLAIAVQDYRVRTFVRPSVRLIVTDLPGNQDDSPVYETGTSLTIRGVCTSPKKRAGEMYEIHLEATPTTPWMFEMKIGDLQQRDEAGRPIFRKRRNDVRPIYEEVPGFGSIRRDGSSEWRACANASPQMVTDALVMLSGDKPVFVSLDETMSERRRKIIGCSITTSDPADESGSIFGDVIVAENAEADEKD